MKKSLVDLGQQLLEAAKRAGADACDAMVVDGVSPSIEVRGGLVGKEILNLKCEISLN